jgi:hypothetical protein
MREVMQEGLENVSDWVWRVESVEYGVGLVGGLETSPGTKPAREQLLELGVWVLQERTS